MRYSLAPKGLLLVVLALTLSLKVMVRDTANENAHATNSPLSMSMLDSVVAFLTRHQFQSHGAPDGSRIYAASGDCRLVIRQMYPQGWNLDGIKSIAAEEGQLFFVFEGLVYTDQPLARTSMGHYWARLQQKLGLDAKERPVFAVTSSESCSLDALPWKEIAEFS